MLHAPNFSFPRCKCDKLLQHVKVGPANMESNVLSNGILWGPLAFLLFIGVDASENRFALILVPGR